MRRWKRLSNAKKPSCDSNHARHCLFRRARGARTFARVRAFSVCKTARGKSGRVRVRLSAAALWRALIIGAGVLFNVLLAWLLLTAGFVAGMPSLVESGKEASFARTEVRVLEVQTGTPAEAAGFAAGDRI